MEKVFIYIVAVWKKLIEAIKDVKMTKIIFENALGMELNKIKTIHNFIRHIIFSVYQNGYEITVEFHNNNSGKFYITFKNGKNVIDYTYSYNDDNSLALNFEHKDYMDILSNVKDKIEPLYKSYMSQIGNLYLN